MLCVRVLYKLCVVHAEYRIGVVCVWPRLYMYITRLYIPYCILLAKLEDPYSFIGHLQSILMSELEKILNQSTPQLLLIVTEIHITCQMEIFNIVQRDLVPFLHIDEWITSVVQDRRHQIHYVFIKKSFSSPITFSNVCLKPTDWSFFQKRKSWSFYGICHPDQCMFDFGTLNGRMWHVWTRDAPHSHFFWSFLQNVIVHVSSHTLCMHTHFDCHIIHSEAFAFLCDFNPFVIMCFITSIATTISVVSDVICRFRNRDVIITIHWSWHEFHLSVDPFNQIWKFCFCPSIYRFGSRVGAVQKEREGVMQVYGLTETTSVRIHAENNAVDPLCLKNFVVSNLCNSHSEHDTFGNSNTRVVCHVNVCDVNVVERFHINENMGHSFFRYVTSSPWMYFWIGAGIGQGDIFW